MPSKPPCPFRIPALSPLRFYFSIDPRRHALIAGTAHGSVIRRVLSSRRIKQHPLPPTSFNFVQKYSFRLTMRTTLLARASSFTHFTSYQLFSLRTLFRRGLFRAALTVEASWPYIFKSLPSGASAEERICK